MHSQRSICEHTNIDLKDIQKRGQFGASCAVCHKSSPVLCHCLLCISSYCGDCFDTHLSAWPSHQLYCQNDGHGRFNLRCRACKIPVVPDYQNVKLGALIQDVLSLLPGCNSKIPDYITDCNLEVLPTCAISVGMLVPKWIYLNKFTELGMRKPSNIVRRNQSNITCRF